MIPVFLALGLICLFYYSAIVIYAGIKADFSWIWLFGALLCLVLAALQKRGLLVSVPLKAKLLIGALTLCVMIPACFWLFQIVQAMGRDPEGELDYVVVLGAQVKGERPSRALLRRLEKAEQYAKDHTQTILILSGGQGSGEDITEAECMRRYLTEHGIAAKRLLIEDRSTSTLENLRFSDDLAQCMQRPVGVLSNHFHVYRAVRIAKKMGYTNVQGIPAASDRLMLVHYVVRELFALANEWRRGTI